MHPSPQGLAGLFSKAFAVPFRVSIATEALDICQLSPGERDQYERLTTPQRRDTWLLGRAALKQLLEQLDESADTASLAFPNRRCSLTHCETYAVAVGANAFSLRGVGVDVELSRSPHQAAARFFLTGHEQAWIAGLGGASQARQLRRLWTVKEAVFKSDPENKQRRLTDYQLHEPAAASGTAFVNGDLDSAMRYLSVGFGHGILSMAVMLSKEASG